MPKSHPSRATKTPKKSRRRLPLNAAPTIKSSWLAKKKGVSLGTDKIKPRSMGKANFDKQYIYTTSHDYQEDIRLFQQEAQSGDDKDLKAYAAKTLPMLKAHLAMLKGAGK